LHLHKVDRWQSLSRPEKLQEGGGLDGRESPRVPGFATDPSFECFIENINKAFWCFSVHQ